MAYGGQHAATLTQDPDNLLFSGRCSCGVSFGVDWYDVARITEQWVAHLTEIREGTARD